MILNFNKVYIVFLIFLFPVIIFANPIELFEAANTAYQRGDFQKAISDYEKILNEGQFSEELYYNLGNAYFKNKQLGKAILNYERALLLSPRDEDIQFNLEIAEAKQKDDIEVISKFFLTDWWQRLHKTFSASIWGTLTVLILWGGIAGLILWMFGSTRKLKKQGFIAGISLILLSVLLYFISNSQASFEKNSQYAIILEAAIELKNGPDAESTEVIEIHEGLKVELLDQIDTWRKVKLSNGEQGWLPDGSYEEI